MVWQSFQLSEGTVCIANHMSGWNHLWLQKEPFVHCICLYLLDLLDENVHQGFIIVCE